MLHLRRQNKDLRSINPSNAESHQQNFWTMDVGLSQNENVGQFYNELTNIYNKME